jgi:hypothetical protein
MEAPDPVADAPSDLGCAGSGGGGAVQRWRGLRLEVLFLSLPPLSLSLLSLTPPSLSDRWQRTRWLRRIQARSCGGAQARAERGRPLPFFLGGMSHQVMATTGVWVEV